MFKKKEPKVLEPEFFTSATNMQTINYHVYYMKKAEKIITFSIAFVVGALVGYLFYGGIGKDEFGQATLVTHILNIVIPTIVGFIAGKLFLPIRVNSIIAKRKSDLTADILNMQLTDFSVSKFPNANLANASIMERQIVDFMKYRAPLNTGLSFLSSLQTFTTLSKQTELVDKRQEYYKQEKTVMEELKSAWEQINKYNGLPVVTDANYFSNMKSSINGWEGVYKSSINKKTIKDLYDTQSYINY